MRLAMTSRVSHSLLVAALAFLALPSYGTAQAPRRPAQADTPYRAATRALNEGRYDDVDAIAEKLTPRSQRRGGEGARRRSRADATRRPRRCCVRSRRACRRAKRRSSSDCCSRCSAGPTPSRCSRRWRRSPTPATIRSRSRAARARCARSAGSTKPTPRIAMRPDAAPERRGDPDRVGRSVPREVRQGRGAEVVSDGAAGRRRNGRRRSSARRARSPTRTRRRRSTLAKRALEVNPSSVDAQIFLAGEAADAEQARRGAAGARQGARGQPVEPRRASRCAPRCLYVEDKPQEFEAEAAKALAIAPRYGEVYRVAGELAGAQLPVRRSGRADAPRPGARRRQLRARRPTSARTCCAPATSRARGSRSRRRSRPIRSTSSTYNLLRRDGQARQVRHRARRRRRDAAGQGRGAGPARVRDGARAPGAQHARGALRVHAARADPRSRSFRSTTTSPSGRSACPA